MRLRKIGAVAMVLMGVQQANAATFECQSNVRSAPYSALQQPLVDRFWGETLTYLKEYADALEKPTGACKSSAEALVQTFDPATNGAQRRCITKYRDVELLVKHVRAVLAEPDKAKRCFDLHNGDQDTAVYTPSRAVQSLSPTSSHIGHPLLSDYYRKIGGPIGQAGMELAGNFREIVGNVDSSAHFKRDIGMKGLPTLWSSVGWVPLYADNPDAGDARFRGGYLYAEVMGPWGNLRIKRIDDELVGAEIGMTVQLGNTSYPMHFHHSQEIYMTLTPPQCVRQNRMLLLNWDNDRFQHHRRDRGWTVEMEGRQRDVDRLFVNQDPSDEWLTYMERNAIHAFDTTADCNRTIKPAGLVTAWARTSARDNSQATDICSPPTGYGELVRMRPDEKTVCKLEDWEP